MSAQALLFDVFGTVVDWRGSIVEAGISTGVDTDWGAFADDWRREGYIQRIGAHLRGEEPWRNHDELVAAALPVLAERHAVPAEHHPSLLRAWHHLRPWPDAPAGLARLRTTYLLGPLSNGGFRQLAQMGKAGGLPWDCILSTDLFRTYKPAPASYLGAAELLGLAPEEVVLVAAHPADLRAAAACGLGTAYVPRPDEWGPDGPVPEVTDEFDVLAADFGELATAYGC